MRSGWRDDPLAVAPRARGRRNYAKRRAALSEAFPGETLIIPSGNEKVRANDTDYPFRPGSDFFYLTGDRDPDSVLVLRPERLGARRRRSTPAQRNSKDTDAFFRSRNGELWIGRTHTLAEKSTELGIETAPLGELGRALADSAPGPHPGAARPRPERRPGGARLRAGPGPAARPRAGLR